MCEEVMRVKKLNCPNCGAKVTKEQIKCKYCGTVLDFEESNPIQKNLSTPTKPNEILSTPTDIEDTGETPVATNENFDDTAESAQIAKEMEEQRIADQRKRKIISCAVSTTLGVIGIVSGIILISKMSYVGIALIALGIICLCKIFYTFMRTSRNMTKAGYLYSLIICILIGGFGIYGGIELIRVSPTIDGKLICIIPFLLSAVSLTYLIAKTFFYFREKKQKA